MQNMKIYRDGKYSVKDNLIHKVKLTAPIVISRIDNFFTNH